MKRKHWRTVVIVAIVLVFYICIAVFADRFAGHGKYVPDTRFIGQMAQYLNEKYGYNVTEEDCVYFREADYSYHKAPIMGWQSDVPNIAIFDYDEKTIVTTERNGFFGDDGQLGELNELLCGYFGELTGLDIAFVELRESANGNVQDWTLNELLHHDYNKLLTSNTIRDFMDQAWQKDADYHLILYLKAEEDITAQVDKITQKLSVLKNYQSLRTMVFYITDMDEPNVLYTPPWALGRTDLQNAGERSEEYIWGHYHVVNDVEHHYPAWEGSIFYDVPYNTFVTGGFWTGSRFHSAGFGNREKTQVNYFTVVDLSDDKLDEYLQEMVSYGQFRGYTVLFQAGNQEGESSFVISEGDMYRWEFQWETGPVKLYTFKNGQLLDLETAYNCAYISYADMDAILAQHEAHRSAP